MEYEDIYVTGIGRHLPDAIEIADAEARGLCARKDVWRTGIEAVCVAEEAPPDMAAAAARRALSDAGAKPSDIELILHASVHYQGHDLWAAASYVQREAVGNTCPAVEVNQQSNGGMAAIELAAAFLASRPGGRGALVSTGDRFAPPGFDRWRTDPGTICGDGGTAMVLSRGGTPRDGRGALRLRSAVSVSDPDLERLGRGARPFADAPLEAARPIDAETPREQAVSELGFAEVLRRLQEGQARAVEDALSEAGVKQADVDWFVLPHLGLPKMNVQFFEPLGIERERTTWDWGRRIGHLGAGDQIAGLGELVASGRLAPGQRCLLAGVGAGFTYSAAVVERTRDAAG
ncbi:ketoacyl-ACP synthase III family protein [Actinomadura citrea]|uniref:3-oxoacyl-[acyl-carrier-protein] synthase-3 n=1 Tax=Actinomadura citrea TaxID=46158 RepID=A0A7Y9KGC3_9ACTN|nr:ketoacyl-ACP synthase III family protein [Actinomadura citrea]NYE14574.1 3-oxoacyl-[acyl-carrier-protein] synthase-3 [Actinomadura citrea]GGU09546.1 3-oxoacyl-[acyl-carrier-protein] synthase 3 protein 3 [Actinomadura citrea]